MARIAEEEIERLKREISLERLAVAKGIQLKKHGENLLGLCPFHDDREPSLVITPSKNLWHCLGACQTGGTVIDWVMQGNRCTTPIWLASPTSAQNEACAISTRRSSVRSWSARCGRQVGESAP